jgi:hypothetical protein
MSEVGSLMVPLTADQAVHVVAFASVCMGLSFVVGAAVLDATVEGLCWLLYHFSSRYRASLDAGWMDPRDERY